MIEVAKEAARQAGAILVRHFRNLPPGAVREKKKNDFISFVDETAEQKIISVIQQTFPDHAFHAEEAGKSRHSHEFEWIIDPLDGTKNYVNGVPVFSVSIGLKQAGEIILGVIFDPIQNELFWAQKGQGAFLNDQPIRVSPASQLSQSFIATGFPFKAKDFLHDYLQAFEAIFSTSVGMRRMGSAAIDLAYVAAGRFDGFWEIGLSIWDVAAGSIIVREAGGRVSDFWNNEDFIEKNYTLATNGRIHDELAAVLQQQFPSYQRVYPKKGA